MANFDPPTYPQDRSPSSPRMDAAALAAALQGNTEEFSKLTEPHRRELQVHCYRILGSLTEAEDMVQETFLRAWKKLATYQGRASFRAWLYKIATNACLDTLDQRRSRRYLPPDLYPASDPQELFSPPAAEVSWLEPYPDEWQTDQAAANPEAHYSTHESISLAFLTALQTLPPRQRAVLILSDVLDWSAREIADLLGITVSAVASALHRARVTLSRTYHGHEGEPRMNLPADEHTQKLLHRYVHAWQTADVEGLVALLKQDASLAMPPSPSWYRGRTAIRQFVSSTVFADQGLFPGKARGRWRLIPVRANGQTAFAAYQWMPTNDYRPSGIHVLTWEGNRLAQITCFLNPALLSHFGVPPTLDS
jgi:RNA polymerase sigma-70 factor (ECF subfamily)